MTAYRAPLTQLRYALHEVFDVGTALAEMPAYSGVDRALIDQIIDEAAVFASEVLAPTRVAGDAGCTLRDGRVFLPAGFAEAYRRFVDAGWPALACAGEHGGQGLPMVLGNVVLEMLNAANPSWAMFPGIAHGAYDLLHAHASPELQSRYLPKIASGEWTTSMCLTEAQAGSDLGLVRTRAEPLGGGRHAITGAKLFISGGDHDAAANIVHLVLARLPDAPPGSRGLSLFLVPRHLPADDDDATLAAAINGIDVVALEHKMGMRGSATCALAFDRAQGWLIGTPNRGLACMFVMMNAARLAVGLQSVGAGELACQHALDYAQSRAQGRDAGNAAVTLSEHADVRRMLMAQRAWTEGGRLLAIWLSLQLDIERHHPDAAAREHAAEVLGLLTPIAKAFLSDNVFEVANLALQIHGGHGYVSEHGVEQIVRDVRVFSIYEGANGIQALDLLARKLLSDRGAALGRLFDEIESTLAGGTDHLEIAALRDLLAVLRPLVAQLDPLRANAVATHLLRALGLAFLGWMLLRAAQLDGEGRPDGPRALMKFYFAQLFPESAYRIAVVRGASLQEPAT
ncbi:acyl-CoA dehydrogenase [Solimonas terrae]|uniref:3-methylmercaptopropionyl-CoA dehydrogenase n=1 Tax=Solimonas terrae TaxID=1396819 RepID=A0A6M2BQ23_9GAMM|nr:acyl-CoA dehydrogenase [Solimonas terrae]NGY04315.1 acyl-CoA dehydrogenase [Solimonas terrae]